MANAKKDYTLAKLFKEINSVFPDGYIEREAARDDLDLNNLNLSESLAAYIVKEVRELYNAQSSKRTNAERISSSLARSAHVLDMVAESLSGRRNL